MKLSATCRPFQERRLVALVAHVVTFTTYGNRTYIHEYEEEEAPERIYCFKNGAEQTPVAIQQHALNSRICRHADREIEYRRYVMNFPIRV